MVVKRYETKAHSRYFAVYTDYADEDIVRNKDNWRYLVIVFVLLPTLSNRIVLLFRGTKFAYIFRGTTIIGILKLISPTAHFENRKFKTITNLPTLRILRIVT